MSAVAFVRQALDLSRRVVPFTAAALLLAAALREEVAVCLVPRASLQRRPICCGHSENAYPEGPRVAMQGNRAGTPVQRILVSGWISCRLTEHTFSDL